MGDRRILDIEILFAALKKKICKVLVEPDFTTLQKELERLKEEASRKIWKDSKRCELFVELRRLNSLSEDTDTDFAFPIAMKTIENVLENKTLRIFVLRTEKPSKERLEEFNSLVEIERRNLDLKFPNAKSLLMTGEVA